MFRSMYGKSDVCASMERLGKLSLKGDAESSFSPFHDYLGLINLIRTTGVTSSLDSPASDTSSTAFEYPSPLYKRHRMDSLDSDALSDSSSSIGSRESEILFESLASTDSLSSVFAHSQPSVEVSQQQQTYAKTLETIIAHQTAINRMNVASTVKETKSSKNANKATVCVFCRNNGESREFYSSHTLKDGNGHTTCPILRAYTCPLCKANGDASHTIKYCPKYTPKLKTDKFLGFPL